MTPQTIPYVNPYIAGNPVHGGFGFFGRADILRQVEQILAAPGQNAVILFGPRRIGKTSILLQLQHSLPATQYTVIYQDLQDKARQPMGELLAGLAAEIADYLNLAEPDLAFDDQGRVFQQEFLPQVYQVLPNQTQRLVLLFDEFDVLDVVQRERLPDNAAANLLFPTLRRWLREEPRLAFVFALGRNLNDLDSDFLSTFKGSQTIKVSVFSKKTTAALITAPTSLHYTPEAIDQIYALTNGHPYFTQLLGSLCFDRAYERLTESSSLPPTVTAEEVEALIPIFFSRGDNVFAWIWDGLPPAERIVAAALAELLTDDATTAAEAEIEAILGQQGIRLVTRDLQVSPKTLVEWGLLQHGENGYRFLVPVLRRWIRQNKPLANTRDELDRVDPRAHRYYLNAKDEYLKNELKAAATNLERVLALNPNHLQAQILLGDVNLEQNKLEEALTIYRQAYQQDKEQVEAKYLAALLRKAEAKAPENPLEAQNIYQRMLAIKPNQPSVEKCITDLQPAIDTYKATLKKRRRWGNFTTFVLVLISGLFIGSILGQLGQPDLAQIGLWMSLFIAGGVFGIGYTDNKSKENSPYSLESFWETIRLSFMNAIGITFAFAFIANQVNSEVVLLSMGYFVSFLLLLVGVWLIFFERSPREEDK
jgi:tetratricopeptide (TPR) repeat protein